MSKADKILGAAVITIITLLMFGLFQNYLNNPLRGCVQTDQNTYWAQYTCKDGHHVYAPVEVAQ